MVTLPEFGICLDNNKTARSFVKSTMWRLRSPDIKTAPYDSKVDVYAKDFKLYVNMSMESIYPPVEKVGVLTFMLMISTFVFSWAVWLFALFGGFTLLFTFIKFTKSKWFHFWVFEKGLRKEGYKGMVQQIPFMAGGYSESNGYIRIFEKSKESWK